MKVQFVFLISLLCSCAAYTPPKFVSAVPEEKNPAAFVFYGDTRRRLEIEIWAKNEDKERNAVIAAIAAEKPDFVIHTGDIVAIGESKFEWQIFDSEMAAIRDAQIPFFPTLGNHDYLNRDRDQAMSHYFGHFPQLYGKKWYDFTVGHALFIMLDSNFPALAKYERNAQRTFLEDRLKWASEAEKIKCVIIATHHPPFTNSTMHGDYKSVQDEFVATAKKCPKFKAYFAGHVHSYERFLVDGVHFVVSGGGGAPLSRVEKKAPRHVDLTNLPEQRGFNFVVCQLTSTGIHCDMKELQKDWTFAVKDSFDISW